MRVGDRPVKKPRRGLAGRRGTGRLAGFFRDTRAGAVGVSSVFIALMCFTGTAMISDHVVLLHHRNVLQAASDSASVAATRQLAGLDRDMTQEQVAGKLAPLAKRYVLANLPEGVRASAKDTLELALTHDRETGVVNIAVSADLGGAIVGRYLWGRLVDKTRVASGVERIVPTVDLVLAIDVTGSMAKSIYATTGGTAAIPANRRINVVRNAAQVLVDGMYGQDKDGGHISVGLVPFNTTVNVGATRRDWVSDLGQGHKVIPAGFGPWRGCIEHREQEEDDLDLSLDTPDEAPFTSWFSPSTLEYRPVERAELAKGATVWGENDWSADDPHENYSQSPHYGCPRDEIVPLTTDRATVKQAIADLQPWSGGGTMTHVGVVWGRRLLASAWRDVWGLPEEPEEPGKKVLVLLTDGVNDAYDSPSTYPGNYWQHGGFRRVEYTSQYTGYGRAGNGTVEEGVRAGTRFDDVKDESQERKRLNKLFLDSCDLAKDDGITVFTVSAVPHGHPKENELRERLAACATSDAHAFVENSEPARMQTAFRAIGRMIQGFRRTSTVKTGS